MQNLENAGQNNDRLTDDIKLNLDKLKKAFSYPTNSDFLIREIYIRSIKADGVLLFLKGMIDTDTLEKHIISPLMTYADDMCKNEDTGTNLMKRVLIGKTVMKLSSLTDVVNEILDGFTVLLIDGYEDAIAIYNVGFEHRGVEKPTIENILKGPKESFTESSEVNCSLIRKSLKDVNLITETMKIGESAKSEVLLLYIKDIINPELLQEVKRRINSVKVDSIQVASVLEQYLEDRAYSLFPSTIVTERPDRVISFLKEGHIAILSSNGAVVLVVPITLWTLFHTSEDIYQRWAYGNFIRLIRYFCCLTALLTPALYMAVTTFNPEMIPADLAMAIMASREKLPFPVFIEIIIMEISFELIREAGVRIPTAVGPTIGIVGTLILGQAAVEANIVSPILVIVVSITGLSSFAIPEMSLSFIIRIGRFIFLVAASTAGFFGIALLLTASIAYMSTITSFGVPFFSPYSPYIPSSGDTFIRPPVWKMILRPQNMNTKDKIRQK